MLLYFVSKVRQRQWQWRFASSLELQGRTAVGMREGRTGPSPTWWTMGRRRRTGSCLNTTGTYCDWEKSFRFCTKRQSPDRRALCALGRPLPQCKSSSSPLPIDRRPVARRYGPPLTCTCTRPPDRATSSKIALPPKRPNRNRPTLVRACPKRKRLLRAAPEPPPLAGAPRLHGPAGAARQAW